MSWKLNLMGHKFNRWTVIAKEKINRHGQTMWLCECECGTRRIVLGGSLRNGKSQSCGCLMRERASMANKRHGHHKTPIYRVWCHMLERCNNQTDAAFHNYGGRGICVCLKWLSFEEFLKDMGEKPKRLTIERIDNDGNYEPSNCKWATRKEQTRNTRHNVMIKYAGETKCISEWAEELGINYQTLYSRLKKLPPKSAFNM